MSPYSAHRPRREFSSIVFVLITRSRPRWSVCRSCCSWDFTATVRVLGRVAASAMAAASAASFLLVLTYGLTYWGEQLYSMPQPRECAPPEVGATTGLHGDGAAWERLNTRQQLGAPQALPEHHGARPVNPMQLKHVFGQIDCEQ
jgi:hypothetical protein